MNLRSLISIYKSHKLYGSFSIYIGSSLLNAAIPFLMLPIFTYYLSPKDFGIVSMFSVLGGFILPFVGFSTVGVLSREYFNRDKINFGQYVGNVLILLFLSLIPIFLVLLILGDFIARLSEVHINVIWLSLVFAFFSFLVNCILIIWQVQSMAKNYGIFQVSQTFINLVLSLILVVWLNLGWQGRIASQVLVTVVFGSIGFYLLNKFVNLNFKYKKEYFFDALKVGIPLIPHTVGAILISMSDRIFISNIVGIEATGLYAVGFSIGNIIGFVEHSFNLAFAPWLFEKLNLNDISIKKKIVRYTYLYFVFILLLVFCLNILVPFIFDLFIDKKFEGAEKFVTWISLSFAFSGMYKMVTNYIFYVKKTHILAWVTLFSSIFNLVLNYYLINILGAIGAAISSAITSFLFFISTWILSNRVYNMPWSIFKLNNKYNTIDK